MTRLPVLERDLGPNSAYRLCLAALGEIAKAEAADPDENVRRCYAGVLDTLGIAVTRADAPPPRAAVFPAIGEEQAADEPRPVRAWSSDWHEALRKLTIHPWPTALPPPAPPPKPGSPAMGMFGGGDESDPHTLAIRPEAPWTREQYEEILHGLALHQPGLPTLDESLAAPDPRLPTAQDYEESRPLPEWTRSLCNWLAVSAHIHAAEGGYAAARQDLRRALAAAAMITRGSPALDNLAAWTCGYVVSTAAAGIAANHPVPPAVLRQMAADLLHQAATSEPLVECIRAELLPLRNFVPHYYRYAHFDPVGYPYDYGRWHQRLVARLAFAAAPLAGSTPRKTTQDLESLFQHWVVLAQKPYSPSVQDEYDTIKEGWSPERTVPGLVFATRDPFGYHLARSIIHTPDYLHACFTTHLAVLRGTALALAIRAFQAEHGSLPVSLKELVPDYLPRLPDDPFSGKPFRYLRSGVPGLAADAWAVYSFGGNCVDDGGTAYTPMGLSPYREPDLVIPSQAYPREWQLKHPPRQWYPGGRSQPRIGRQGGNL
jgi:hypothetical protein